MLGRARFPFQTTGAEAITSDKGGVHVQNEEVNLCWWGEESIKEIIVQQAGQSQKLSVPLQSSYTFLHHDKHRRALFFHHSKLHCIFALKLTSLCTAWPISQPILAYCRYQSQHILCQPIRNKNCAVQKFQRCIWDSLETVSVLHCLSIRALTSLFFQSKMSQLGIWPRYALTNSKDTYQKWWKYLHWPQKYSIALLLTTASSSWFTNEKHVSLTRGPVTHLVSRGARWGV